MRNGPIVAFSIKQDILFRITGGGMKKIILISSMLMIALCFVGCPSAPPEDVNTETPAPDESDNPPPEEVIEYAVLNFVNHYSKDSVGITEKIYFDGEYIVTLWNEESYEMAVVVGDHIVTGEVCWGIGSGAVVQYYDIYDEIYVPKTGLTWRWYK